MKEKEFSTGRKKGMKEGRRLYAVSHLRCIDYTNAKLPVVA